MPNFISLKREAFICKCRNCSTSDTNGIEFSNFQEIETHLNTLNMTFFNCPIYGCTHRLVAHSATITTHIKNNHKKVAQNLKLSEDDKSAFYCNECNIYTDAIHFHCLECKNDSKKVYFKSKEACSKHLKENHNKWWLEHDCKRGTSCPGFKSGKCGFNHLKHPNKFILNDSKDSKVCRYEKPWDDMRCNKKDCSFDHLWGRVRFLIKMKGKEKSNDEYISRTTRIVIQRNPLNKDVDWEAMGIDPDFFDKNSEKSSSGEEETGSSDSGESSSDSGESSSDSGDEEKESGGSEKSSSGKSSSGKESNESDTHTDHSSCCSSISDKDSLI